MKASNFLTLSIFILFVQFATSAFNLDAFIKCLSAQSRSSIPISSSIYTPNNDSFSSILLQRIHNRRFSTPTTHKPLAIIAAKDEFHIQATILCSKSHGIQMRIRSGGHDYEGISYVSDVPFILLDMFNLNSIDLDMGSETAWVKSGATLGDLYYKIAVNSRTHAFPAGVCPTVGAGGHFSGGGYGNLMRKYGLSVDNIIDAILIDVNGKIMDRKAMGEDLFWAIRGGGGASFGVILSWKIKLVKVPFNVTVFNVKRTLAQGATNMVYKWQTVAPQLHEDLFMRAQPEVVTVNGAKTVLVSFVGQFLGPANSLVPLVNQVFPELGLKISDCLEVSWGESAVYWYFNKLGSISLLLNKPKQPTSFYKRKSDYVQQPISKSALESIWALMIQDGKVWMQWNPYGGKMASISESATPFPHRAGNLYMIHYSIDWKEEEIEAIKYYINATRKVYEAMTPYVSKSPRQVIQNYRDLDIGANQPSNVTNYQTATVYGSKYFKSNFQRLVQAKTMVDPQNFFRHEQSIPTSL